MITGRDDLQRAYQDERVARDYVAERFMTPLGALLHDSQVRVVRDLIASQGIRRAVELAPGPARVSVEVLPDLDDAVLIDSSQQMLDEARRRLDAKGVTTRVHLQQGDAFALPAIDPAPLVYSFRLIRHFERSDRVRLYQQIRSVLAPGGWLVFDAVNRRVSEPIRAKSKPGEHVHFDALLTPDEIRAELDESGFELVALQGVQHRYPMLVRCQVLVAPRADRLARRLMGLLDRSGGDPLEWVVTCRRR